MSVSNKLTHAIKDRVVASNSIGVTIQQMFVGELTFTFLAM